MMYYLFGNKTLISPSHLHLKAQRARRRFSLRSKTEAKIEKYDCSLLRKGFLFVPLHCHSIWVFGGNFDTSTENCPVRHLLLASSRRSCATSGVHHDPSLPVGFLAAAGTSSPISAWMWMFAFILHGLLP